MSIKPPTVVIIGAGSLFFGRQAIWAVNHLPGLRGGVVRLVDNDPDHLEKMSALGRLVAESAGSGTRVEAFADYREALPGADFVVLSFSTANAHYRRMDCEISARYGIRMCSGDTIGPGGVFRTLRDFPRILEIAHAVEELCPEAWLINYVNPSAVMGIGLMRHSKAKSFALCDTHHMPYKKLGYLNLLTPDNEKLKEFDCRIAGVNHFTWMLKAELEGKDVLPLLKEHHRIEAAHEKDLGYAKRRFNYRITDQLAEVFGALPTCTGHTKEYLPFYQGRSAMQESVPPLSVFDCDEREERTATMWNEVSDYVSGKKPVSEFHTAFKSDHATDVIHTMTVEDGKTYFINRTNSDAVGGGKPVDNLPADAFLELECQLDRHGPRPLPVGAFPLGLRGLQALILDVHELTIEAVVKRDRQLLVRALSIDPLVNSIATAEAVIDDLFRAQKEILSDWPVKEVTERAVVSSRSGDSLQLY